MQLSHSQRSCLSSRLGSKQKNSQTCSVVGKIPIHSSSSRRACSFCCWYGFGMKIAFLSALKCGLVAAGSRRGESGVEDVNTPTRAKEFSETSQGLWVSVDVRENLNGGDGRTHLGRQHNSQRTRKFPLNPKPLSRAGEKRDRDENSSSLASFSLHRLVAVWFRLELVEFWLSVRLSIISGERKKLRSCGNKFSFRVKWKSSTHNFLRCSVSVRVS